MATARKASEKVYLLVWQQEHGGNQEDNGGYGAQDCI